MNAWHECASYAARDRMHRYEQEAARNRLLRAAAPSHGGLARWRHSAAAALHRLADAVAPQTNAGTSSGVPGGLGTRGGPLG